MRELQAAERDILTAVVAADLGDAVSAWQRWKASWAGESSTGWIAAPHEQLSLVAPAWSRLRRSGIADNDYSMLDGVSRATWVCTARQLHLTKRLLHLIQGQTPVLVMKGAALIARGSSMSSRRISDLDILVKRPELPRVLKLLEEQGFTPLLGASFESIERRLAQRRDGWNFEDASGAQIDIHWQFGEAHQPANSGVEESVWATCEQSSLLDAPVNIPKPACLAAYGVYHAFVRGTPRDHLQALVDLHELLDACSFDEVLLWGERLGVGDEVGFSLQLLNETSQSPSLTAIQTWSPTFAPPPTEPWKGLLPGNDVSHSKTRKVRQARVSLANSDARVCRYPRLYRLWEAFGRSPALERLLLLLGPLSLPVASRPETHLLDFADPRVIDAVAGPGWSWTDPADGGTWTDGRDARLLLAVPRQSQGFVKVYLAGSWHRPVNQDGNFSANPRGDIYLNGRHVVDYNVWDPTQPNPISIPFKSGHRRWLEVSIRPLTGPDPNTLHSVYAGWQRSLLIGHVEMHINAVD